MEWDGRGMLYDRSGRQSLQHLSSSSADSQTVQKKRQKQARSQGRVKKL